MIWGTVAKVIQREGIKRMNRQYVHLSADVETAKKVGARHGSPVVFVVYASDMYLAGYKFFQSENGVWLTDFVAPCYLRMPGA